ncbi:MAG TPA: PQQ-dependent sugar dehydrogenase [Flavisolibacter sp.]
MRKFYTVLFLLCSLFSYVVSSAQQAISYSAFISGLSAPVEVVNAADGTNRLFIVQQGGQIRVYDPANGGLQATPFLNVSSIVTSGGERGLLSIAFHPQYETNGYFFIYYNNAAGDITVARYQASGTSNVANAASGVVLLNIPKPFDNHNGGHLQFGKDGNLYFATGDGGSGNDPFNNAQDSTKILGKMLRINVDNFSTPPYYTVPASNPFYTTPNFDNRIWARGLRNPYRWSFDRLTGDMWIGDVGQGAKEEINFTPVSSSGGENYGWKCYEGSIRTPDVDVCDPVNYHPPVYDYNNPSPGASSVVGGYVYRGMEYPYFNGFYVAADVYSGNVYILKSNGSGGITSRIVTGLQNFVVGFGEAEDGTLYAVSQATNTVYKVVPNATVLAVSISSFTGRRNSQVNDLQWTTVSEQNLVKYIVEYSADGIRFSPVGEVAARGNSNGSTHSFTHSLATNAAAFYRLQIIERNSSSYSSIVKINGKGGAYQLYPTLVKESRFYVISDGPVYKIQIVNSSGSLVHEKSTNGLSGQLLVHLPLLAKGAYFVRIIGERLESKMIMVE